MYEEDNTSISSITHKLVNLCGSELTMGIISHMDFKVNPTVRFTGCFIGDDDGGSNVIDSGFFIKIPPAAINMKFFEKIQGIRITRHKAGAGHLAFFRTLVIDVASGRPDDASFVVNGKFV